MKSKGRKNNKNLKMVSATALTVFSLFAIFVASIAWFSFNNNTDTNGMNIDIGDIGGHLQYVYFHDLSSYVPEVKDGNGNVTTPAYFNFTKNPFITYEYNWGTGAMSKIPVNANPTDEWIMGDYYYDDREHPILIVFAFDQDYTSSKVGDMYVQGITTVGGTIQYAYDEENDPEHTTPLYTTNGGFLGARDNNGTPLYSLPQTDLNDVSHPERILMRHALAKDSNGDQLYVDEERTIPLYYDYYALSSVVDFQYRTFDDASYTAFKNTDNNNLIFAANTLTDGEAFTAINTSTDKFLFNQTPYFYKSDGHSTVKYIALVVNYSPEAIGYIYSTYLGDSGLDDYWGVLRFDCDWRFEVA